MSEQNETVKKRITVVVSQNWQIIPEDLRSIFIGALMAMSGAALLALADYLSGINVGTSPYAPFIAAILSIVVNAIRKWATKSVHPADGSKPF